jgi:hypothetical protein
MDTESVLSEVLTGDLCGCVCPSDKHKISKDVPLPKAVSCLPFSEEAHVRSGRSSCGFCGALIRIGTSSSRDLIFISLRFSNYTA